MSVLINTNKMHKLSSFLSHVLFTGNAKIADEL